MDHVSVDAFLADLDRNVAKLTTALGDGPYEPQAIRRVYIPKPGSHERRPLGIPTIRDRVVQGAVRHVIEPIFEREFAERSYGFRPGRGCKDALRQVDDLLKQGYVYVVDADLKSYFDTIPHDRLMARLRERSGPTARACRVSSRILTRRCAVGLGIFSIAIARRSRRWTVGCGVARGAFSASVPVAGATAGAPTINGGRMHTLPRMGSSPWKSPIRRRVNPLGGKTISWKAGCRKSARPVWREGGAEINRSSLPLSKGIG